MIVKLYLDVDEVVGVDLRVSQVERMREIMVEEVWIGCCNRIRIGIEQCGVDHAECGKIWMDNGAGEQMDVLV